MTTGDLTTVQKLSTNTITKPTTPLTGITSENTIFNSTSIISETTKSTVSLDIPSSEVPTLVSDAAHDVTVSPTDGVATETANVTFVHTKPYTTDNDTVPATTSTSATSKETTESTNLDYSTAAITNDTTEQISKTTPETDLTKIGVTSGVTQSSITGGDEVLLSGQFKITNLDWKNNLAHKMSHDYKVLNESITVKVSIYAIHTGNVSCHTFNDKILCDGDIVLFICYEVHII